MIWFIFTFYNFYMLVGMRIGGKSSEGIFFLKNDEHVGVDQHGLAQELVKVSGEGGSL